MSNEVAIDYLNKLLKPYLDQYYGKSEEILEFLKNKIREEIIGLILNEGELERLTSMNMIYPTSKAQTASDKDKLRLTKCDHSFVLQYSRENAAGLSAIECTMEIFKILHPIANSFQCSIGLEVMHDASEESTIYELDMLCKGLLTILL
jgi:predicted house-cleaning noncanonical NTP pyrophosphatase (MazG superfamily)